MKVVDSKIQLSASDLVNFLSCQHLTELDRKVATKEIDKPTDNNPAIAILHRKGLDHEKAYLQFLRDNGLEIEDLSEKFSLKATEDAMKKGVDVIYQAPLEKDSWTGIADFLIRKKGNSKLGEFHYEVYDTKLSNETKAGTVVQLCIYSEIISSLQGLDPEEMKVVKPNLDNQFAYDIFRYTDFKAYLNQVKRVFETFIQDSPHETYPVPVSRCEICRWWKNCDRVWHVDDHLSLVAGMRTSARKVIENEEVSTLEVFACRDQPLDKRPSNGSVETFEKLHGQAKVQLEGRLQNKRIYKVLEVEEKRGLNRLPEPSKGDIYFDIEGDHFYPNGGLEYLFGFTYSENGNIKYQGIWCQDRKSENEAFTKWLSFVIKRWEEDPNMHIYHYGHYEPTAVKKLASRNAHGEEEVDRLLRGHKFIDLYSITKETLQASVESYTLKEIEKFAGFARKADLHAVSGARRNYASALELNVIDQLDKEIIPLIELYNQDDCLATQALHQWIEGVFQEVKLIEPSLKRPDYEEEEASDQVKERDQRVRALFDELTHDISLNHNERNNEEQAKWLLAHLIAYYRREERSNAWEFHYLNDLELDELFYERKAIAYLKFTKDLSEDGKTLHEYTFQEQEVSLKNGDTVKAILGEKVGSIYEIRKNGIVIKKANDTVKNIHPSAVIENNYIPTTGLENALQDLTSEILKNGFQLKGAYKIAKELLLGTNPSLNSQKGGDLRKDGEPLVDAGIRLANDLENSYLANQGPPGPGKSYTGALMIIDLVKKKRKVGITAVSHSVIRGLINKVLDLSIDDEDIQCVHKTSKNNERARLAFQSDNSRAINELDKYKVVGGTAFLWARVEAIDRLDYLFVDEAGQMSLAYVLAISRCAKNIVLLGDPQQLEQPQKGAHPEGSDVSALEHILKGAKTIQSDRGLFLDTTWRLHPEICRFTSEVYYENKLCPEKDNKNQKLNSDSEFTGAGLFFVPVEHEGRSNQSSEEVSKIKAIVDELLGSNSTWTDRDGLAHPLTSENILVVAPYNAQVNALSEVLPNLEVGTVDKFQGKEAPVVIYSMASSSPEEAPRGMSFLYDPNRLNVATSRAQCISILVASPKLMMPECHTIDQMKWANGLCRYLELSTKN